MLLISNKECIKEFDGVMAWCILQVLSKYLVVHDFLANLPEIQQ